MHCTMLTGIGPCPCPWLTRQVCTEALQRPVARQLLPLHCEALWLRCQAHKHASRWHQALLDLQQLSKLQPERPELLRELQHVAAGCVQERRAQREAQPHHSKDRASASGSGSGSEGSCSSGCAAGVGHQEGQWLHVLGLGAGAAGSGEVKEAYKRLAVVWHPDKWAGASGAEQRHASEQFQLVQRAYEGLRGAQGVGQ